MKNSDQDEENGFFYHSPETGASVNFRNTPSEEEEDEKRRKRLNLSGNYIQLKFKEVEVQDPQDLSKKIKTYHIVDDKDVTHAIEKNNGHGFLYDDINFDGKGPLEIKIPCSSTKDANGKKTFSKECDVLYFDKTGKLIAFEKGNSKETQLDQEWLKEKLQNNLGIEEKDLDRALQPKFTKSIAPAITNNHVISSEEPSPQPLPRNPIVNDSTTPFHVPPTININNHSTPNNQSLNLDNQELATLRKRVEELEKELAGTSVTSTVTNKTVDSPSQTDATGTSTSNQGTGTILGSEVVNNQLKDVGSINHLSSNGGTSTDTVNTNEGITEIRKEGQPDNIPTAVVEGTHTLTNDNGVGGKNISTVLTHPTEGLEEKKDSSSDFAQGTSEDFNKLKEENEKLKTEIKELKKQLQPFLDTEKAAVEKEKEKASEKDRLIEEANKIVNDELFAKAAEETKTEKMANYVKILNEAIELNPEKKEDYQKELSRGLYQMTVHSAEYERIAKELEESQKADKLYKENIAQYTGEIEEAIKNSIKISYNKEKKKMQCSIQGIETFDLEISDPGLTKTNYNKLAELFPNEIEKINKNPFSSPRMPSKSDIQDIIETDYWSKLKKALDNKLKNALPNQDSSKDYDLEIREKQKIFDDYKGALKGCNVEAKISDYYFVLIKGEDRTDLPVGIIGLKKEEKNLVAFIHNSEGKVTQFNLGEVEISDKEMKYGMRTSKKIEFLDKLQKSENMTLYPLELVNEKFKSYILRLGKEHEDLQKNYKKRPNPVPNQPKAISVPKKREDRVVKANEDTPSSKKPTYKVLNNKEEQLDEGQVGIIVKEDKKIQFKIANGDWHKTDYEDSKKITAGNIENYKISISLTISRYKTDIFKKLLSSDYDKETPSLKGLEVIKGEDFLNALIDELVKKQTKGKENKDNKIIKVITSLINDDKVDVSIIKPKNLQDFLEKIKENKDSIKVIDKIPTEKLKEFVSNNEGLTTDLLGIMIEKGEIESATKLIEAGADVNKVERQVIKYLVLEHKDKEKANQFFELLHSKVVKKAAENKAKTKDDLDMQDMAKKIRDIFSSNHLIKEFVVTPSNFKNRDNKKKKAYEI